VTEPKVKLSLFKERAILATLPALQSSNCPLHNSVEAESGHPSPEQIVRTLDDIYDKPHPRYLVVTKSVVLKIMLLHRNAHALLTGQTRRAWQGIGGIP
jgi:hypothetical protein